MKVTFLFIFLDYLCILFCDVSLSWSFFIISNTTFFILFYILKDKNGMKKVKKRSENAQWRKNKQMQPIWLWILLSRLFEDTFEDAQCWKVKQMQPMWICLFSGRPFEDTFEKAQWRKVKQMQPMWLCILLCKQFEESFEKTQWRKVRQMQPM